MRVEFHPDAETELSEAAAWYHDQHLAELAGRSKGRTCGPKDLTSRFPFAIAYQTSGTVILAQHLAVLVLARP